MQNTLLRGALLANAGFSGVTGLTALALAGTLEEALGPPSWSLRILGAGLLIFAALVSLEARSPRRSGTWQIISADVAWVVAAGAIVVVAPPWMTGVGRIVLAVITFAVAALATAQWRGLGNDGRVQR